MTSIQFANGCESPKSLILLQRLRLTRDKRVNLSTHLTRFAFFVTFATLAQEPV